MDSGTQVRPGQPVADPRGTLVGAMLAVPSLSEIMTEATAKQLVDAMLAVPSLSEIMEGPPQAVSEEGRLRDALREAAMERLINRIEAEETA